METPDQDRAPASLTKFRGGAERDFCLFRKRLAGKGLIAMHILYNLEVDFILRKIHTKEYIDVIGE